MTIEQLTDLIYNHLEYRIPDDQKESFEAECEELALMIIQKSMNDKTRGGDIKSSVGLVWVCNECNAESFTSSVSEEEINNGLCQCVDCGCNEFHLVKMQDGGIIEEPEIEFA